MDEDDVAEAFVAATPAGVNTRGYCSCVNQCDETERGGFGSTLATEAEERAIEDTFKSRSSVKYSCAVPSGDAVESRGICFQVDEDT